jgi:hypothetical protein
MAEPQEQENDWRLYIAIRMVSPNASQEDIDNDTSIKGGQNGL